MNIYYDILGLKPGASQTEIKKAYFKLVRQYPPEANPEQFQKIREAYEHLQKGEDTLEVPQFPPLSDPWAEKFMRQIEAYKREGNQEMARDACEEAWHLFPDDICFLYLLAIAQRQCGNTGKSVKNAELLVKKEPENKWFYRELALSYQARGYANKAYNAFAKAYEMGCRDNDFLIMYSIECDERDEYEAFEKGMQVLLEIVRKDIKWSKEDVHDLFEAYNGLLSFNSKLQSSFFPEIIEGLCRRLEQYKIYAAESMPSLAFILSTNAVCSCNGPAEYQAVRRAFDIMYNACRTDDDRDDVRQYEKMFELNRLKDDFRIGETLEYAYEAYFEIYDMDERTRKFALTDVQLCMLEERQEILEQAKILQQEYPDFYVKLESFIKRLQEEKNLAYLKDSLLKTYRRLAGDFSLGLYYEKYPHAKQKEIKISDSDSEEPYVRSSKKIGRNDTCPCGSGKKYKHCCMKN